MKLNEDPVFNKRDRLRLPMSKHMLAFRLTWRGCHQDIFLENTMLVLMPDSDRTLDALSNIGVRE